MLIQTLALRDSFFVSDETKVEAFIAAHDTRQMLHEVHQKIKEYFPSELLHVYVYQDPDDTDANQLQIDIYVTEDETESAHQKMLAFCNGWWNEGFERARGRIAVGLTY